MFSAISVTLQILTATRLPYSSIFHNTLVTTIKKHWKDHFVGNIIHLTMAERTDSIYPSVGAIYEGVIKRTRF